MTFSVVIPTFRRPETLFPAPLQTHLGHFRPGLR